MINSANDLTCFEIKIALYLLHQALDLSVSVLKARGSTHAYFLLQLVDFRLWFLLLVTIY